MPKIGVVKPKPPENVCKACGGTGKNSKGAPCVHVLNDKGNSSMDLIFFRPNAPISSLLDCLPMESIRIEDECLSETLTDAQGRAIAWKEDWEGDDRGEDNIKLQRLVISSLMAFIELSDTCEWTADFEEPEEFPLSWEAFLALVEGWLRKRGWILVEPVREGRKDCYLGEDTFLQLDFVRVEEPKAEEETTE